ncbi:MAG: hypothetical protein ACI9XU_001591 [Arenicella sp.]|jgi:hypothetical protein
MWVKCIRAMTILSVFLMSSLIPVESKVVVIPSDDDLMVIPLAVEVPVATGFCANVPLGTILCDELTASKSSGTVRGGTFTDDGWKHVSGEDKIFWGLDQTMEAGIVEFELTGMTANTRGGYTGQPGSERAYYFGIFNDSSGNKQGGGTAFIEIRYNWGSSYVSSSAVKLQAGTDFRDPGDHSELFGTKKRGDWNGSSVYKHRVVFGDGQATLYIDGQFQTTVPYVNKSLRWSHVFLGDINYAGMSGPDNVTYRNLLVIKTK